LFGSVFSVCLGLEAFSPRMAVGGAVILICIMLTEVDFLRLPYAKKR